MPKSPLFNFCSSIPEENGIDKDHVGNGDAVEEVDSICKHAPNKHLCLPPSYSKFELPYTDSVNIVEIGIDISDVLRINDKVHNIK